MISDDDIPSNENDTQSIPDLPQQPSDRLIKSDVDPNEKPIWSDIKPKKD